VSIVIIKDSTENICVKANMRMWVGLTIYGARMWCGAHIKETETRLEQSISMNHNKASQLMYL
jgi:hypothetical protein